MNTGLIDLCSSRSIFYKCMYQIFYNNNSNDNNNKNYSYICENTCLHIPTQIDLCTYLYLVWTAWRCFRLAWTYLRCWQISALSAIQVFLPFTVKNKSKHTLRRTTFMKQAFNYHSSKTFPWKKKTILIENLLSIIFTKSWNAILSTGCCKLLECFGTYLHSAHQSCWHYHHRYSAAGHSRILCRAHDCDCDCDCDCDHDRDPGRPATAPRTAAASPFGIAVRAEGWETTSFDLFRNNSHDLNIITTFQSKRQTANGAANNHPQSLFIR